MSCLLRGFVAVTQQQNDLVSGQRNINRNFHVFSKTLCSMGVHIMHAGLVSPIARKSLLEAEFGTNRHEFATKFPSQRAAKWPHTQRGAECDLPILNQADASVCASYTILELNTCPSLCAKHPCYWRWHTACSSPSERIE